MVVKSSSEGREPLKSSDTNRPREGPCKSFKPKNGKAIAPKIRGTTNYILVSPSKKLLPSASIKSSPSKHQDQENITPRTPEKSELLHKTPQKLSTAFIKLSPSSLGSSPSQRIGNPCFSSVFSTPSSSSASPSSSCISGSPNSPVVKVEEDLQQPDSPIINALNQTHSPDSLLGTDSRSIVGGGLNLSGSCIKRVATRHGPLGGQPGPPVSRRNARERNRVKQVSMGFAMLRQHVPHSNRKKKLSKVETLRCAVEYIKNLQSLLQENPHPLHPTTSSTSSLQQKIPVAANFQTQGATPSSESFLHLQVSSHLDLQQREGDRGPFSLQKMSHLSSSFQQGGQANAFYEDRLSLQPMPNGSSCLEPQLLKVPKMEEHFQTPVYSSSIFTIPSVSFVKTPTMAFSSSLVGSLDGGSCPGESKDILPSMVSDAAADYTHGFPQQKDVGEVDLMEALAWWQHNS